MDLEFLNGKFTEAELENAIIALFQEQGYNYVYGDAIHRQFEDILIAKDFPTEQ